MKTRAMLMKEPGRELEFVELALPELSENQVLIEVSACAVCRTDLHIFDFDLKFPRLPLVLGHEIVGRVLETSDEQEILQTGDRVAVAWLAETCGQCRYCTSGRENLCDSPSFTGYTRNGGFAGHTIANAAFTFKIPESLAAYKDEEIAPMLCAGLIGWRSFKFAAGAKYEAEGRRLGIYGFGAAGHLVLQIANYYGWQSYAFTRKGDKRGQEFARKLGAFWAGSSEELPPDSLDSAIIFAPLGELLPLALKALVKGGTLVCGGIHMSDIPQFSYEHLWGERSICSVANLTRTDATEFLNLAGKIGLKAHIHCYQLSDANQAIADLRAGAFEGAAVLSMGV